MINVRLGSIPGGEHLMSDAVAAVELTVLTVILATYAAFGDRLRLEAARLRCKRDVHRAGYDLGHEAGYRLGYAEGRRVQLVAVPGYRRLGP